MTPSLWLSGYFFCALALLAWGAGTQRVLPAALMAAALLAAALSPYRLASSPKAKSRSNDATFALILIAGFWYWLQRQSLQTSFALQLLGLCPILLYPKLFFGALQHASSAAAASNHSRDGIAVARFWLEAHVGFSRRHLDRRKSVSFEAVYFFLCSFIASLTLPAREGAVAIMVAIVAYCLRQGWNPAASLARSTVLALVALGIVGSGAFAGGAAIEKFQTATESFWAKAWNRRSGGSAMADAISTGIGRAGRIELGSSLVARVDWPLRQGYLRTGLFSRTGDGSSWQAVERSSSSDQGPALASVYPTDGSSFLLSKKPAPKNLAAPLQARISTTIQKPLASIPLPPGTTEVFGWPLNTIQVNALGVAVSPSPAGFVKYGASFHPDRDTQAAPSDADLEVPIQLRGMIDAFVAEAGAEGLPPAQAAAAIEALFKSGWTYTLELQTRDGSVRTLSRFLRSDRSGHCEYFASVSTLAMRRLGHPARFAAGFLVSEFDEDENLFWVRERDGHAWSTYWDGQAWRLLDATPPGQGESLSWGSTGSDFFARLQYLIEDFDFAGFSSRVDSRWLWALGALAAAYALRRSRPSRRKKGAPSLNAELLTARVERATGLTRRAEESSGDFWLRAAPLAGPVQERLEALARDRNRALFRPMADREAALASSEATAKSLISALPKKPPKPARA